MSIPISETFADNVKRGLSFVQNQELENAAAGKFQGASQIIGKLLIDPNLRSDIKIIETAAKALYPNPTKESLPLLYRFGFTAPMTIEAIAMRNALTFGLHLIKETSPPPLGTFFVKMVEDRFDSVTGFPGRPDGEMMVEEIGRSTLERNGIDTSGLPVLTTLNSEYETTIYRRQFGYAMSLYEEADVLFEAPSLLETVKKLEQINHIDLSFLD